jgi:N-acetylglucosaminyldiphosphoundecaprenol N-acetyl-beta-D-mannosaminyltransferase
LQIDFFDTCINITNIEEQKKQLIASLGEKQLRVFYYLNSYSFYLIHKNSTFKKAFNNADYIIPDGQSIVWGVKIINKTKIEKVTVNHSFFDFILQTLAEKQSRIYLLGSQEIILQKAIKNLENKAEINICGFHHGYFNQEKSEEIVTNINISNPNILLVGMGMPTSEIWIDENYNNFGNYIIMTVGNLFDIIAGERKMAPNIFYKSGLEWLYRMLQEPSYLFKRYLKSNFYFLYKVLLYKLKWLNEG